MFFEKNHCLFAGQGHSPSYQDRTQLTEVVRRFPKKSWGSGNRGPLSPLIKRPRQSLEIDRDFGYDPSSDSK